MFRKQYNFFFINDIYFQLDNIKALRCYMMNRYDKIELYGIDFTHYRLIDLIDLANQAEPFYRWI